jgi:hypothetical protein
MSEQVETNRTPPRLAPIPNNTPELPNNIPAPPNNIELRPGVVSPRTSAGRRPSPVLVRTFRSAQVPHSYLNASIGFNRPAFHAGYNPANNPTAEHTRIPPTNHPHGTTKPVSRKIENEFPTNHPQHHPKCTPLSG